MWAICFAMWAFFLQARQYVSKIFYNHLICEHKNSTSIAICEHGNMWAYFLLCEHGIYKQCNMWAKFSTSISYVRKKFHKHGNMWACNMWAYLFLCDISCIYITKSTNMWAISSQIHMAICEQIKLFYHYNHLLYDINQHGMAMFITKNLGFHQKSRVPPQ